MSNKTDEKNKQTKIDLTSELSSIKIESVDELREIISTYNVHEDNIMEFGELVDDFKTITSFFKKDFNNKQLKNILIKLIPYKLDLPLWCFSINHNLRLVSPERFLLLYPYYKVIMKSEHDFVYKCSKITLTQAKTIALKCASVTDQSVMNELDFKTWVDEYYNLLNIILPDNKLSLDIFRDMKQNQLKDIIHQLSIRSLMDENQMLRLQTQNFNQIASRNVSFGNMIGDTVNSLPIRGMTSLVSQMIPFRE